VDLGVADALHAVPRSMKLLASPIFIARHKRASGVAH
jgi:hypothetical protein